MALDWKDSSIEEVEIIWSDFETVIPVSNKKELLNIKVELINTESFAGFFDSLVLEKNLINDKLLAAEIVYIPFEGALEGDAINRTVFGSMDVNRIVKIAYVPEASITGSATDYMQLQIVHDPSGNVLSTKTFIQEVIGEQRLVFEFGPVNDTFAIISAGESLRLVKQDTGAGMPLPRGLLIIQWDVA